MRYDGSNLSVSVGYGEVLFICHTLCHDILLYDRVTNLHVGRCFQGQII